MIQPTEGTVIRESRIMSSGEKASILIVVIVMTIIVGGWWWFNQMNTTLNSEENVVILESAANGLAEIATVDVVPTGTISLIQSEIQTVGASALPFVYRYDLQNNTSQKFSDNSYVAYLSLSATRALIINKASGISGYSIGVRDTNSGTTSSLRTVKADSMTDATLSSNKKMLAYSYKNITQDAEVVNTIDASINNWNIVVTALDGMTPDVIIKGAIEPEWVFNDTAILFMKTDGLYSMDIGSGMITLLFDSYAQLMSFDDLSVSPESDTAIFTRPEENTIRKISLTKSDDGNISVLESGQIYSDLISYSSPVFSPDGEFYSVIASTVSEVESNTEIPMYKSEISIETRHIEAATVIKEYKIMSPIVGGVTLAEWLKN